MQAQQRVINWPLTEQQLQYVAGVLQQRPHGEVAQLIKSLAMAVQAAQMTPPENAKENVPTAPAKRTRGKAKAKVAAAS